MVSSSMPIWHMIIYMMSLVFLVVIPIVIAYRREHPHAIIIALISVLGWPLFLIGPLVGLIWSCTKFVPKGGQLINEH